MWLWFSVLRSFLPLFVWEDEWKWVLSEGSKYDSSSISVFLDPEIVLDKKQVLDDAGPEVIKSVYLVNQNAHEFRELVLKGITFCEKWWPIWSETRHSKFCSNWARETSSIQLSGCIKRLCNGQKQQWLFLDVNLFVWRNFDNSDNHMRNYYK